MTERHRNNPRCAIYTRKSSEEGLEQEFNSLEAQREACAAYIKSQTHEGWRTIPERFDDGGFSGGTLERPALQALLELVRDKQVDVIVIYKIDRLTRSLMDFANLAELFDKESVSFVSVTQQFNTTTSMGRLMLNVLLSFAQFEREITGERIRDKIAASKKKGIWMGGAVPVGYSVKDRQLVINKEEARTVRALFQLYLKHGTVRKVWAEAGRLGLKTKVRTKADGRVVGGMQFFPGHIYTVLKCPIYVGEIPHKGESYPGAHRPIIDRATWEGVQSLMAQNRRERHAYAQARLRSPLAGLLFDASGTRFTPTHTVKKNGQRYRYYVDQALTKGIAAATADLPRIPALEIEQIVRTGFIAFLRDTPRVLEALPDDPRGAVAERALKQAKNLCDELEAATPSTWMPFVRPALERVIIETSAVRMRIAPAGLRTALGMANEPQAAAMTDVRGHDRKPIYEYVILGQIRLRGGMKTIMWNVNSGLRESPDKILIKSISRALAWADMLKSGKANSIRTIANGEALTESYVIRVMRLAFLAPQIVDDILDGKSSLRLADWLQVGQLISPIWATQMRRLRAPKPWKV